VGWREGARNEGDFSMALSVRTKRILGNALCGDKVLNAELATKIVTAAAPSARLRKAIYIMLPDKASYLEFVAAVTSGSATLSTKAQATLDEALADRRALVEILAALA